jgi:simple sugar transport system ATP-binding protein
LYHVTTKGVWMQVRIRNLCKSFGSLKANNEISIDFAAGQIHGILGENGAGKSTLMKILSGVYTADSGVIEIDGVTVTLGRPAISVASGIGMVGQDPLDVPVFSVIDNIACGLHMPTGVQLRLVFDQWCDQLGFSINPDQQIQSLTVGQRQQVEIVRLLIAGSQLLILDEPTTGITADQVTALFAALRTIAQNGKTVLFVTHKLDELMALCDTATVLRAGCVVGVQYTLPISKDVILNAMFGELSHTSANHQRVQPSDADRWVLRNVVMRDTSFSLGPFDKSLPKGAIVGLAGLEGSGQRMFLYHLAGLQSAVQGQITCDEHVLHGYQSDVVFLPADRLHEGIVAEMNLVEHVRLLRAQLLPSGKDARSKAQELIAEYDIKATPDTPLSLLSGGNQQRAMLALIPDEVRGILLEHPTRGLDARSAVAVWQRLQLRRDSGTSVVFFSADLEEVMRYSDYVIVFFGGQISRVIPRSDLTEQRLAELIGGVGFAEVSA